jgi:hypothetical protein
MATSDPEQLHPTVPFVPAPSDDCKFLALQLDGIGISVSAAEIATWTEKERSEVDAWIMAMPVQLLKATIH